MVGSSPRSGGRYRSARSSTRDRRAAAAGAAAAAPLVDRGGRSQEVVVGHNVLCQRENARPKHEEMLGVV
jgi:hypothetical protein